LLAKFAGWVGNNPDDPDRGRDTSLPAAQQLNTDQSFVVRSFMFNMIRNKRNFPRAARVLQMWYEQKAQIPMTTPTDVNAIPLGQGYRTRRQNAGTFDPNQSTAQANAAPNAITGITCVDSRFHPAGLSGTTYQNIYNLYSQRSRYGADSIIAMVYRCM
jgi:hypothetical protein